MQAFRQNRVRYAILIAATLTALSGSLMADEPFSSWREASGKSNIQYRWRRDSLSNCDIQFRDLGEPNSKTYYTGTIDYANRGEDRSSKIYHLGPFVLKEQIEHELVTYCDRITDVLLTAN
jgi:hypothetical protein